MKSKSRITATKMAGRNHAVHTVEGGSGAFCVEPCTECPWRKSNTGSFPAEAFKHSANTAEDMSTHTFACHMAGAETPKVCAGFLLNGAADNLSVRMHRARGRMLGVRTGGAKLHKSYRAMAIANGVPKTSPAIARCMPECARP